MVFGLWYHVEYRTAIETAQRFGRYKGVGRHSLALPAGRGGGRCSPAQHGDRLLLPSLAAIRRAPLHAPPQGDQLGVGLRLGCIRRPIPRAAPGPQCTMAAGSAASCSRGGVHFQSATPATSLAPERIASTYRSSVGKCSSWTGNALNRPLPARDTARSWPDAAAPTGSAGRSRDEQCKSCRSNKLWQFSGFLPAGCNKLTCLSIYCSDGSEEIRSSGRAAGGITLSFARPERADHSGRSTGGRKVTCSARVATQSKAPRRSFISAKGHEVTCVHDEHERFSGSIDASHMAVES
jgi:hypothetical protein